MASWANALQTVFPGVPALVVVDRRVQLRSSLLSPPRDRVRRVQGSVGVDVALTYFPLPYRPWTDANRLAVVELIDADLAVVFSSGLRRVAHRLSNGLQVPAAPAMEAGL